MANWSDNVERTVWDRVADCESGEWDRHGKPIKGTADWASSEHRTFAGGLQFHPKTWTWVAPAAFPTEAHRASREQQIVVARKVLHLQGWKAWPVCSRKLGLR